MPYQQGARFVPGGRVLTRGPGGFMQAHMERPHWADANGNWVAPPVPVRAAAAAIRAQRPFRPVGALPPPGAALGAPAPVPGMVAPAAAASPGPVSYGRFGANEPYPGANQDHAALVAHYIGQLQAGRF